MLEIKAFCIRHIPRTEMINIENSKLEEKGIFSMRCNQCMNIIMITTSVKDEEMELEMT